MSYCAYLQNVIDEKEPFSMKNIPKSWKEDIKQHQQFGCHPKKFKYKNETGIFEAAIYLDDYYRVVIDALIISKKFIIIDSDGILIQDNGKVFYYLEDNTHKRRVKTNTGFIIDDDKKDKILDFIKEMESFSKHLREKYYKNK